MSNDAKSVKIPAGIGAVLTNSTGEVLAHAFDFERSGYGGFKLWEAQRIRAKRAATWKYVRAYSYGDLADAISDYTAEELVRTLLQKGKLRMTCVAIGYDDELTATEVNQ